MRDARGQGGRSAFCAPTLAHIDGSQINEHQAVVRGDHIHLFRRESGVCPSCCWSRIGVSCMSTVKTSFCQSPSDDSSSIAEKKTDGAMMALASPIGGW